jgi:hypothetical protein
MSSTPIYDELAAIHLADLPTTAQPGKEQPEPVDDQAVARPSGGGRRRKPEPDA